MWRLRSSGRSHTRRVTTRSASHLKPSITVLCQALRLNLSNQSNADLVRQVRTWIENLCTFPPLNTDYNMVSSWIPIFDLEICELIFSYTQPMQSRRGPPQAHLPTGPINLKLLVLICIQSLSLPLVSDKDYNVQNNGVFQPVSTWPCFLIQCFHYGAISHLAGFPMI